MEILTICSDEPDPDSVGHWDKCYVCKTPIFVSQSTINSVIKQGYFAEDMCPHCILCGQEKLMVTGKNIEPIPFTEEQLTEIRNALEKNP